MTNDLQERREQPFLDMERIPRAETRVDFDRGEPGPSPGSVPILLLVHEQGVETTKPAWVLRHATSLATVEMAWLQLELNGVPVTYPDGKMVIAFVDKRHGERLRDYLNEIGAFPSAT